MAFNYKLPKLNSDKAYFVDTPVAGTTEDLTQGLFTLLDESDNTAIDMLISDIYGWKYDAYSAGVAHVVDVDFTGATLIANNLYALTVRVPYLVNFFGGGNHATAGTKESRAEYVTRTYTVSTDATAPFAIELSDLFKAQIDNDVQFAAFSAASAAGVLTITALSAQGGQMEISTTAPLATVADATAWISPVGSLSEVQAETGSSLQVGATYDRYIIGFRDYLRHNAVKGLQVVKPSILVYYLDSANGGTAATVAAITNILDGTILSPGDYLGAPNF